MLNGLDHGRKATTRGKESNLQTFLILKLTSERPVIIQGRREMN